MLQKYGLSLEDYSKLLTIQNGACAVCLQPEQALNKNKNPKHLAVDHDHQANRVRGLLCQNCNTAIGLMGDDIIRLRAAITYLLSR